MLGIVVSQLIHTAFVLFCVAVRLHGGIEGTLKVICAPGKMLLSVGVDDRATKSSDGEDVAKPAFLTHAFKVTLCPAVTLVGLSKPKIVRSGSKEGGGGGGGDENIALVNV